MKFFCKKIEFLKILTGVRKAIPTKSPLTILEGFLIQATEQTIRVTGYNMEFGISAEFSATVEESGSIVLNAKLLTEIVKKLPGETLIFEATENLETHIFSENCKFNLIGLEADDFPQLPQVSDDIVLNLDSSVAQSMIEQTIFAVATDAEKLVHTGVLMTLTEKTLKLVAIDGYRMALRQEFLDNAVEFRCIIPAKVLSEILKLLPETEQEENCQNQLKICVSNTHVLFKIDSFVIVSRLLSGEFTDYKKILVQDVKTTISVETKSMIECFERVALMLNDRINTAIRCTIQDQQINFLCKTAIGNAEDVLNCEVIGENLSIGLNHRFMLDALKNSKCEQVTIEFSGSLKPVKITSSENTNFIFVVLPVRLHEQ